jgi:hypothetical protein
VVQIYIQAGQDYLQQIPSIYLMDSDYVCVYIYIYIYIYIYMLSFCKLFMCCRFLSYSCVVVLHVHQRLHMRAECHPVFS